ncbi:hypothetical protein DN412_28170 [Cupriavidus lacunae]|uniref:Uncharacterized protein n=1 Tax=Cupriavidus lacunae TaxID=2666307 RepID=A0A370NN54_9BURK|nr:hypothetical protein DN412_28170 [Cupriavidus lacunae]
MTLRQGCHDSDCMQSACSPLPLAGEGQGEMAGAGRPTRFTSSMLQPSPQPSPALTPQSCNRI